ncbi:MAG: MoaD/ThiS family protein [Gammaproteobacteria bacterium]|nr:MoaD/ThiS family protein [Gammaproteobacteria bacterium]
MRVLIPSPLQSYTSRARLVTASGATLGALLNDLDRRYPGIRFRMIDEQDGIRPHMMIYVRGERTRDLTTALDEHEEVVIMQALSGG